MDANQQKPAPTPTAVLQPVGERRMEETDPKTIEDPKVMIHRAQTIHTSVQTGRLRPSRGGF